MADIDVTALTIADAHELAPLIAAYTQEQKRGAPRAPDQYYAELLLKDRTAELLGARTGGRLVGFAVFFDLPDALTGMRAGQLDELFVAHEARETGVARRLVDALAEIGAARGWTQMRWVVPAKPVAARLAAEDLAIPGGWETFTIPMAH